MNSHSGSLFPMLGGTCCSIMGLIPWTNLLQTVILAVVGTLVSYLLTRLLQRKRK
ncbi:hypothetical protein [Sphingobacterium alkalisoli]|uniref:hypothetical protein n=1 Tax=Sphingobacterium alkalisoli TaxID=1874115 RepID=UPI00145CA4D8|nr:hypothetical protein [Sphingobacterium alkalisoli]